MYQRLWFQLSVEFLSFSPCHICRSWNVQDGFFTSISGVWVGMDGAAWAGWSLLSLSTWHLCSSSWTASQNGSVRVVRLIWLLASSISSVLRVIGESARFLWPSLRNSKTSLPWNPIGQAGYSQLRFQGMGNRLHLSDGRRSKKFVVIFNPPQASYWSTLLGIRCLAETSVGSTWPQIYIRQWLAKFF